MPTYEYECKKCNDTFDVFQNMSDKPLKKCPTCGGKVQRLIGTGAGIIFKGSGFYQTDYRSQNYTNAQKADKKPSSSASDKKTTKTDKSKAVAKSDSKKTDSKKTSK